MITLVIRNVPFEHMHPLIDLRDQPELLDHQMHRTYSAAVHSPRPFGHLIMNVAGAQHRLGLLAPTPIVIQAALNSLLAVADNLRIFSFHSKCSFLLDWFV